jgi:hypothetical protein
MCPIFRKDILLYLLHSFTENKSGWGLDLLWPHLLGSPRFKIAVLDACPVKHTRARGTGDFYQDLTEHPEKEMLDVVNKYQLPWPHKMVQYGAIPSYKC